jgi:hypothetical protein
LVGGGGMAFVDLPNLYIKTVAEFLKGEATESSPYGKTSMSNAVTAQS